MLQSRYWRGIIQRTFQETPRTSIQRSTLSNTLLRNTRLNLGTMAKTPVVDRETKALFDRLGSEAIIVCRVPSILIRSHLTQRQKGDKTYVDPSTGFSVFTSEFHLSRGYCCGNACRHCPFEFENVGKGVEEIKEVARLKKKLP